MRVLFFLLIVLTTGCETIKSGAHHDETFFGFSGYDSFAWIADDPLVLGEKETSPISPLTKKKIVARIEETLRKKGFHKAVSAQDADFILAYTVGTRDKIDSSSYPVSYRGEWGWDLYGRYYYANEPVHTMHTEGTLGVDVFDGPTKQPVWHGWATKTITNADRSDPDPMIERGVRLMFNQFPSKGGAFSVVSN
ncbi:MAG: DUF4136 domain-containing protein [Pseudomonadota bacterium]